METIEDRLQLVLRDADALIDHIDDMAVRLLAHHQPDRSIGLGILVGVLDQIQQHLTQTARIGLGDGVSLLHRRWQLQMQWPLQGAAGQIGHQFQLVRQPHRFVLNAQFAGVTPGQVQQVVHQPAHADAFLFGGAQTPHLGLGEVVSTFHGAVQVALNNRQRRAQLMADGAHELPLLAPRLRQPLEQSVVSAPQLHHLHRPTLQGQPGRGECLGGHLSGGGIELFQGLHDLRAEKLAPLGADTVVVIDTHWFTTIEHVVASHDRRHGLYTSEELPRGMKQMPYDMPGDRALAEAWAATSVDRDDTWITAIDDEYLPVHYPTINLLPFLQGDERWVSAGICQTAEPEDFLLFGALLAEAVAGLDRRVVVLASGGLSHQFWPLRQFRDHEAADPAKHLRTPEARAADEQVLAWMRAGDHAAIIDFMPEFAQHAPEGFFGHYLTMVGALGGADCTWTGTQFGEYEAVSGTGQAHVWFEA